MVKCNRKISKWLLSKASIEKYLNYLVHQLLTIDNLDYKKVPYVIMFLLQYKTPGSWLDQDSTLVKSCKLLLHYLYSLKYKLINFG